MKQKIFSGISFSLSIMILSISTLADKGCLGHWSNHGQVFFPAQKKKNQNEINFLCYPISEELKNWFCEFLCLGRWNKQIKGWERNRWNVSAPVLTNCNASKSRDILGLLL